ncbi:hypothetical protein CPB83DRAFT_898105 [Crepidotus variabilis]|uniref:Uncharacterized protein n=1 Tax=Crepidotus variabilis TaxID=179855 RepID=A0A9P6E7W2_9AGAR|nr:hypothetical protein CPB83DRAFT_898105 [Crepidotus variabilis]
MPECREDHIGALIIGEFVTDHPDPQDRTVSNVYADKIKKELRADNLDDKHVQKIESHLQPNIPIAQQKMVLKKAHYDPRNYVLEFIDGNNQSSWFPLQPLTHTVVQIYTKQTWENSIMKVDQENRGFKISIAFEFRTHVMAWVSLDNVFQPSWEYSRQDLQIEYHDVYSNFHGFLSDIAKWMHEQRGGKSSGAMVLKPKERLLLALTVVRDEKVWHGVGVYTVSEIFHIAGLSPFLTEGELFDYPSRTARLCAAYYAFAQVGHGELWKFIQKKMVGYVVAVSVKDRSKYADFLYVWGKQRTYMSERHYQLMKVNPEGINSEKDAFEPTLIEAALRLPTLNLGPLIFGTEAWKRLSQSANLPLSTLDENNPLAKHFKRIRPLSKMNLAPATHLQLCAYKTLFLDRNDCGLTMRHMPPFLYRTLNVAKVRDVWSLHHQKSHQALTLVDDLKEKEKHHLDNITQYSNIMTVGPLDFSGIARVVNGRAGNVVLMCENDPCVDQFYVMRRQFQKATVVLKGKGEAKTGIEITKKRKIERRVIESNFFNFFNVFSGPSPDDETKHPIKRIRRSADRDLAAQSALASTSASHCGRTLRTLRERKWT